MTSSCAAEPATDVDGFIRFGRYWLHEKLGEGGMAEVFTASLIDGAEAMHPLVLKRIRGFDSPEDCATRMFITEGRVSIRLRHPAIARTFEFGHVGGEPYIVMERIDGIDLMRALRCCRELKRPMPPALVCHLLAEIGSALAYAHARTDSDGRPLEIVHRDVSPSNIMVSKDGRIKLLDFGVAKVAAHLRHEQTSAGVLKGKISYMSPEQIGGLVIDGRSDLFALGIVAHECLTLERVLRGHTDLETLSIILNGQAPAPSTIVPDIPPELDAIVLRLLSRDRDARFASGAELLAALAPLRERFPADANSVRVWLAALTPAADSAPAPVPTLASMAGAEAPEIATDRQSVTLALVAASEAPEILPRRIERVVEEPRRAAALPLETLPPMPVQLLLVPVQLLLVLVPAQPLLAPAQPPRVPAQPPLVPPKLLLVPPKPPRVPPASRVPPKPPASLPMAFVPPRAPRRRAQRPLAERAATALALTMLTTLMVATVLQASVAPPPPAGGLPASGRQVQLHLRGAQGATALLDGENMGRLPLALVLAARPETRRLLVVAGSQRWGQDVAGDIDAFVRVEAPRHLRYDDPAGSVTGRPLSGPGSP
jgi:eukaryotic-like serine/threonine-protein kinase